MNRITPLYSYLPLTCALLDDALIREAEHYWVEAKPADLQFGPETLRFSEAFRRRAEDGEIENPFLIEVLELELAANALRWGAEGATRSVRFVHDPRPVLEALADGRQPDADSIATGEYTVGLDVVNGKVALRFVERAVGPAQ